MQTEKTFAIKWTRYLSKFHTTYYLHVPKEYTDALHLDQDTLMEIVATTEGALIIRPVEAKEEAANDNL